MMGIGRSEYRTVLDATSVILGGGDPEFLDGKDRASALFEPGFTLKALMNELATEQRADPTDDASGGTTSTR